MVAQTEMSEFFFILTDYFLKELYMINKDKDEGGFYYES